MFKRSLSYDSSGLRVCVPDYILLFTFFCNHNFSGEGNEI